MPLMIDDWWLITLHYTNTSSDMGALCHAVACDHTSPSDDDDWQWLFNVETIHFLLQIRCMPNLKRQVPTNSWIVLFKIRTAKKLLAQPKPQPTRQTQPLPNSEKVWFGAGCSPLCDSCGVFHTVGHAFFDCWEVDGGGIAGGEKHFWWSFSARNHRKSHLFVHRRLGGGKRFTTWLDPLPYLTTRWITLLVVPHTHKSCFGELIELIQLNNIKFKKERLGNNSTQNYHN